MCEAKPGPRCAADTYKRYAATKAALEGLPAGASGLERARALTAHQLAAADYAATFPRQNPGLAAAARRFRVEQANLMPDKPAINEAGAAEYDALARARDQLASVTTSAWEAEVRGNASYEVSQALYEEAVFNVARAEEAFRHVGWAHYDTVDAAARELAEATASGDADAIYEAKAVYYLTQRPDWPDQARARYAKALAGTDERQIDQASAEREASETALERIVPLVNRTFPHAVLTRERPGEAMPPAPWVASPRDVDAIDTPQVRYLCEGGASEVRWNRQENVIEVRHPNQATVQRLWAYGYHTEPSTNAATVRVSKAPAVTRKHQSMLSRKAV